MLETVFSTIDSTLNANRSIALGATIAATNQNGSFSQSELLANKFGQATLDSNNKIVTAINSLKTDLDGLVSKVEQMNVVMDTGASSWSNST